MLFLCTGNTTRSQLAEAIINARLHGRWEAFSAGAKPGGYVHPKALKVLSEIGIEHHGRSKSIEEFRGEHFDLVVTLCSQAEGECPVWLEQGKQVHMPFQDPGKVRGSDEKTLEAFRVVRDAIERDIVGLLTGP